MSTVEPSSELIPSLSEAKGIHKLLSPTINVSRSQLIVVVTLVVISDLLLFQGSSGYTGWAIWSCLACLSVLIGIGHNISPTYSRKQTFLVCCMIVLASVKLVWQGNLVLPGFVIALLIALIFVIHDLPRRLKTLVEFLGEWPVFGCISVLQAVGSSQGLGANRIRWFEYGVPALFSGVFATLFVLANPDIVTEAGYLLRFGLTSFSQ